MKCGWFVIALLVAIGCAQPAPQPSDITLTVKKGWTTSQVMESVGKPTATFESPETPNEPLVWLYVFPELNLSVDVNFDANGRVTRMETGKHR